MHGCLVHCRHYGFGCPSAIELPSQDPTYCVRYLNNIDVELEFKWRTIVQ